MCFLYNFLSALFVCFNIVLSCNALIESECDYKQVLAIVKNVQDRLIEKDRETDYLKEILDKQAQEIALLKERLDNVEDDFRFKTNDDSFPRKATHVVQKKKDVSTQKKNERTVPLTTSSKILGPRIDRQVSVETVAFYAKLSAPHCYGNGHIIVFDDEVTDTGNSYNSHSGIFAAPNDGVYVFAVTVMPAFRRYISAEIVADGKTVGAILGDSEDNTSHHAGSVTVVVQLTMGAHVYVEHARSNGDCALNSDDFSYTTFAGWMLF